MEHNLTRGLRQVIRAKRQAEGFWLFRLTKAEGGSFITPHYASACVTLATPPVRSSCFVLVQLAVGDPGFSNK